MTLVAAACSLSIVTGKPNTLTKLTTATPPIGLRVKSTRGRHAWNPRDVLNHLHEQRQLIDGLDVRVRRVDGHDHRIDITPTILAKEIEHRCDARA